MQIYMSISAGNKSSHIDKETCKSVEKDYFNLRFIDSLSHLVTDLKARCILKFKNVLKEFGSHAERWLEKTNFSILIKLPVKSSWK